MLDRLSVPRRALDFEDYVDILRRNFRWIIGPVFFGIVVSTVTAFMMEDTYVSSAMIRVVPQQISGNIIQSINAQDVSDRINGMAQNMMSRSTLTALISTFGLYKSELKDEPMEDVLTKMRDAIRIQPTMNVTNIAQNGKNIPAMLVQFSYRDRLVAQKVCSELVSRFMNASSQEGLENSLASHSFLNDEFENAKRTLATAEQALSDYRVKNAGRLPDEMQANIAQMNALQQRAGSLSDAATRNSERRMMLESSLRIANDRLRAVKSTTPTSQARNDKAMQVEKDIEDLQSNIAAMQERYTNEYPDLQSAKDRLASLKRQRDETAKNNAKPEAPSADSPALTRERMEAQAQVEILNTQIKAAQLEEQSIGKESSLTNGAIRGYQSRIEAQPAGEKEYTELLRDRDQAKNYFVDMQEKMHKAKLSNDMEVRKQGETLELLDNANTPTSPAKPQRALIIPIGLVGGLALGLVLVAIREVRDTSLKNLKDARLYTNLSILGSIPLLENDVVVQRRKQVMWVGWATATALGLAIMGGSMAHYFLSRS